MSERVDSEADLIESYLAPLASGLPGAFGLRDDAALLSIPADRDLVVATDPIIAGVHFFADDAPGDIAWKALAVNVSDLAAKAARPYAYVLTLAFPEAPERRWMQGFADGLHDAQTAFGFQLAGGDTDRGTGPLAIGVTAIGVVAKGSFVRRRGAQAGDRVFVTGTLGDAALGLKLRQGLRSPEELQSSDDRQFLINRYLRPQPRLALTEALSRHASAALDISDGFLKDLSRLAGSLGLRVPFAALPISDAARRFLATDDRLQVEVVAGGGDYELLMSVAEENVPAFRQSALDAGVHVTDIGVLQPQGGVEVVGREGTPVGLERSGYDHFAR